MYRLSKRIYDKSAKVPAEKMRAYSELKSNANVVWEDAKANNDFKSFAPYLEKILSMQKELLTYRDEDKHPYDMLLDDYEEGATMESLDVFFGKLRENIVPLLKRVMDSNNHPDASFLSIPVPIETQRKTGRMLSEKVGYDFNRGMLRETEHPFCNAIDRNDVRITTKYHENNFIKSFYSVIHECGHGIYELNGNDEIAFTILDGGVKGGMHEGQSRFYENIIGRSAAFWEHVCDDVKALLPEQFNSISADKFFAAANVVKPSLIRIEADELTYPLHIMLRYEIEKLLLSEDIDVYELPRIWNEKVEEYLGITPPNDTLGILQDVHWSIGLIGYFPSYAIGSALAAQFASYMEKDFDVNAVIRKGEIAVLTNWLKKHIHGHGKMYTPEELIKRIAGEPLNVDYYIDYLTKKFTGVYNI
jgi:carboxypeptidase Taq